MYQRGGDAVTLLKFADFIRRNPLLPVKVIAERLNCHQRNVQKFLSKIEVIEERGRDPVNNRRNVKLYRIELPEEKREALKANEPRT